MADTPAKPRRRWTRFTLRKLFVVTTVLACYFGLTKATGDNPMRALLAAAIAWILWELSDVVVWWIFGPRKASEQPPATQADRRE